ncbi:hypothetical protein L1887_01429 [Cichorium endivia]|nr:hypothetical protein L1887_01429 [Cichorium endivia]
MSRPAYSTFCPVAAATVVAPVKCCCDGSGAGGLLQWWWHWWDTSDRELPCSIDFVADSLSDYQTDVSIRFSMDEVAVSDPSVSASMLMTFLVELMRSLCMILRIDMA